MQAQILGTTRDDVAAQWPMALMFLMGDVGGMEFQQKVQTAVTTFLKSPKSLTVTHGAGGSGLLRRGGQDARRRPDEASRPACCRHHPSTTERRPVAAPRKGVCHAVPVRRRRSCRRCRPRPVHAGGRRRGAGRDRDQGMGRVDRRLARLAGLLPVSHLRCGGQARGAVRPDDPQPGAVGVDIGFGPSPSPASPRRRTAASPPTASRRTKARWRQGRSSSPCRMPR